MSHLGWMRAVLLSSALLGCGGPRGAAGESERRASSLESCSKIAFPLDAYYAAQQAETWRCADGNGVAKAGGVACTKAGALTQGAVIYRYAPLAPIVASLLDVQGCTLGAKLEYYGLIDPVKNLPGDTAAFNSVVTELQAALPKTGSADCPSGVFWAANVPGSGGAVERFVCADHFSASVVTPQPASAFDPGCVAKFQTFTQNTDYNQRWELPVNVRTCYRNWLGKMTCPIAGFVYYGQGVTTYGTLPVLGFGTTAETLTQQDCTLGAKLEAFGLVPKAKNLPADASVFNATVTEVLAGLNSASGNACSGGAGWKVVNTPWVVGGKTLEGFVCADFFSGAEPAADGGEAAPLPPADLTVGQVTVSFASGACGEMWPTFTNTGTTKTEVEVSWIEEKKPSWPGVRCTLPIGAGKAVTDCEVTDVKGGGLRTLTFTATTKDATATTKVGMLCAN
ncbi:MAG: hypothetical protein IT371_29800 [Deltaproteobacteria bacterium]|nr:hypothetical protein [Deltaproteobacteria bacterium]